MKKLVILAMTVLAAGSSAVLADPRDRDHDGHRDGHRDGRWEYSRPRDWCEGKARRLHEYEHRARADGIITREERHTIHALEDDLARSCGGGRWAPDRGWYRR